MVRACRRGNAELFQKDGNDQRARVVICRVTFRIVRHHENRMLDDSRLVCQPVQMIELYGGSAGWKFFCCYLGEFGAGGWVTLGSYLLHTSLLFFSVACPPPLCLSY